MPSQPIFPKTVFQKKIFEHFDICNRLASGHQLKNVFYEFKNAILLEYGTPTGYDLQVFTKIIRFYKHFHGMEWEYYNVVKGSMDDCREELYDNAFHPEDAHEHCIGVRWSSDHYHILNRTILFMENKEQNDLFGEQLQKIYHSPTTEFKYENWKKQKKQSEKFAYYLPLCQNIIEGVREPKEKPGDDFNKSYEWLQIYFTKYHALQ